jgi:hypothetical protein
MLSNTGKKVAFSLGAAVIGVALAGAVPGTAKADGWHHGWHHGWGPRVTFGYGYPYYGARPRVYYPPSYYYPPAYYGAPYAPYGGGLNVTIPIR